MGHDKASGPDQIKQLVVDFFQGPLGTPNAISLRIRVYGYKQRLLTMKLSRLYSSREMIKPLDRMASLQKILSRSSRLSNLMWWLSLHPIAFVPRSQIPQNG